MELTFSTVPEVTGVPSTDQVTRAGGREPAVRQDSWYTRPALTAAGSAVSRVSSGASSRSSRTAADRDPVRLVLAAEQRSRPPSWRRDTPASARSLRTVPAADTETAASRRRPSSDQLSRGGGRPADRHTRQVPTV